MSAKGQLLQDPFLNALRKEHVPVSIYLVNGIKLQGQIESFDQYVVLLKNTVTQMVYKHAISTVVPARPVTVRLSAPRTPERSRAILVSLDIGKAQSEDRAEEAARLIESAGAEVVEVIRGRRDRPDAKTFAGSGKVEEIHVAVIDKKAEVVVFDQSLSPGQVRNLETALSADGPGVRVIDRTELTLEIFARRARTSEGKLQVELAQLE